MNGRVTLVTGGASGIGAACVRELAAVGHRVVAADIDESGARHVAASATGQGGTVEGRRVDVRDPDSVRALVDGIMATYGSLRVVVNCAGTTGPRAHLADYPPDAFASVIAVNLCGVFHVMHHTLPALSSSDGGVIVNIASVAGHRAHSAHGPYVAAKHAVIGLTRTAAREYADAGIRVVSVSPGLIETPMTADLPAALLAGALDDVPVKRMGRPEHVAHTVAFLVSDDAQYITGSDHAVDGGYLTS